MADSYTGEIRIFAGKFAPENWAYCNGQIIAISQNEALYSLTGVIYGGNGVTNFGLPDMRGRIPINFGSAPWTAGYNIGATLGTEVVTLTPENIPSHTHKLMASNDAITLNIDPKGQVTGVTDIPFYATSPQTTNLAAEAIGNTGENQAHPNMMPYFALNFIISLNATYPERNP
ncbi:phage tail protein [Hahella sp. KA22]|uniref:phage tail protein n=1 Tax=Hahella sp. KA22 TaxID=1628392 RepID=UPI000FDE9103|nr:tail fiber protein [Hahella sp. KA22]AZZ94467.1 phage tail protein [Hahella sp. KA22]QAY57840.1 phage tail protein [Hahella sp. KA22]